jgi:hypothetical protein
MTGRDQLRPAEEEFRAGVAEMGTRGRCQQIRTRFGLGRWAMRREQEGTHGSGRRRWSVAWGKEAIRNSRITTATCQIKGTGLSWVGSTPNVMRRRLALQQPQHPLF